ncbi:hypothetical protein ABH935_001122 [Catenulispora sp. GAS73]|uniref:VOC family protein n=1 Tax=Catenulispora sp. GAS73 TaxID=3156269 RepID=UPI00351306A7
MKLAGVVIDALDVAALESFWTEATRGRTDGLGLRFAPTDRPKAGKNRLHLDVAGGPDWPAEVERLLALGATRADIGQGDVPWDVLADPEGNEFCVLRPGHPGVLADAGLVAICLDIAEQDRAERSAFWMSRTGWTHFESGAWGFRLRRADDSPVSLVMGPPAAAKTGRNRLRLDVLAPDSDSGELLDPAGNEYEVRGGATARG